MSKIDVTDTKILELLEEDARRSFTEIAHKLKVSESAIRKESQQCRKKE